MISLIIFDIAVGWNNGIAILIVGIIIAWNNYLGTAITTTVKGIVLRTFSNEGTS